MKLYRVDPVTGEAMDEVYYLKQQLASDPSRKDVRDRLNALKSQRRMKLLADAGVPSERRYKRSDLPTTVVVAVVQTYGFRTWEVLTETFPEKVVYRAMERDNDRGYLGCGTSIVRSWLEQRGYDLIHSERNKVIC